MCILVYQSLRDVHVSRVRGCSGGLEERLFVRAVGCCSSPARYRESEKVQCSVAPTNTSEKKVSIVDTRQSYEGWSYCSLPSARAMCDSRTAVSTVESCVYTSYVQHTIQVYASVSLARCTYACATGAHSPPKGLSHVYVGGINSREVHAGVRATCDTRCQPLPTCN